MTEFAHDGAVVFYLLIAGALTLVFGMIALVLLRRAILRNMMSTSGVPFPAEDRPRRSSDTPLRFETLSVESATAGAGGGHTRLLRRHALAHIAAGLVYASLATVVFFRADGIELLPMRTAIAVWAYAWPTVLILGMLVGPDRRVQALIAGGYFGVLAVMCVISWLRGTTPLEIFGLSIPGFAQPAFFWLLTAAPSGFLLLFLNRTIRSIGPLVLLFTFVMLLGSYAAVTLTTIEWSRNLVVLLAVRLGIGGATAFWGIQVIGAILAIWPAWRVAVWLSGRYAAKRSSELLLTANAIWLLMSAMMAVTLYSMHGILPAFLGALPWIAWRVTLGLALRPLLQVARARPPMRLLLLRVYGFGRRSRRLLDLLGTRWRLLGSIDLIAAPDLASRTVEPSTFLDFVRGRLKRLFIRSPDDLKQRIASIDHRPDPDARFRINQLFCTDDMWKPAVTRLMGDASLVAMDLRGFGPHRRGCVYELETLLDTVPLDRLVFLIDKTTDRTALEAVVLTQWQRLVVDSPNLAVERPTLRLLDASAADTSAVRHLLTIAEQSQPGVPAKARDQDAGLAAKQPVTAGGV